MISNWLNRRKLQRHINLLEANIRFLDESRQQAAQRQFDMERQLREAKKQMARLPGGSDLLTLVKGMK